MRVTSILDVSVSLPSVGTNGAARLNARLHESAQLIPRAIG